MRCLALLAVLAFFAAPALAAEPPRADPTQQALVQMIGEAQTATRCGSCCGAARPRHGRARRRRPPARAEAELTPLQLNTPARFAAYPAGSVYRGPAAPVIVDTADKRVFRTRLRATVADPVAFAGEYALSLWGCGGGCVQGAVVSKRTGAVTALPGSASGWGRVPASFRPFVYRADSNLLVVFGRVNEEGPVAATFYRFVDGTFVKFKVVPVSPDMPEYDAYVSRL